MTASWQESLEQLRSIISKQNGLNAHDAQEAGRTLNDLGSAINLIVQNLQTTEERTRTLVSAIPVGLLICSGTGRVEAANPTSLALFRCGYADELRGRELKQLFQPDKASPHSIDEIVDWRLAQTTEVSAISVHGQSFPAMISVHRFATPGESRLLVTVEDITERKALERLKEEFVSMLSHDLKTPLTSIRLFMDLVASGRYEQDLESMRKRARGLEQESLRLITMVNSLLEIHKMESSGLEMFFDIEPCAQLVKQSLQSVEPIAEENSIGIVISEIDKRLHVKADAHYIVQVMVNLLSNAIKFSPPGREVNLKIEATEQLVKFIIRDEGPGIRPEFRNRMFNRFEQSDRTEDRLKGGSGLGLAIAKAIVEQHGGTIDVESEQGKGSAFFFTLQRVDLDI
jgi:PAS domain S-box-containing protein